MPQISDELARLLGLAGYPAAAVNDFDWSRLLVVQNIGPVPPEEGHPEYSGWNRGVGLALIDARGRPTHYVKCRPVGGGTAGRESRVLAALGANPDLRSLLPTVRESASTRAHLQLIPYLAGENFEAVGDVMKPAAWADAINGILDAMDRIASAANAQCVEWQGPDDMISVAEEVAPVLEYLQALGLSAHDAAILRDATDRAGMVRAQLQHGDLWPANIIKSKSGWRILDFEHYGVLRLPLFDALHLIRSAPGLRRAALSGVWLQAITDPQNAWSRTSQMLIRSAADRRQLDDPHIVGLMVFYLATMTSVLQRRGNQPFIWERLLRETQRLAMLLRSPEERARLPWKTRL